MKRKALFPAGSKPIADAMRLPLGRVCGNLILVTGMTGSNPDGTIRESLEDQFRQAFDKINAVLHEAGCDSAAVVEMTS